MMSIFNLVFFSAGHAMQGCASNDIFIALSRADCSSATTVTDTFTANQPMTNASKPMNTADPIDNVTPPSPMGAVCGSDYSDSADNFCTNQALSNGDVSYICISLALYFSVISFFS